MRGLALVFAALGQGLGGGGARGPAAASRLKSVILGAARAGRA